jgi:hypothetical protein
MHGYAVKRPLYWLGYRGSSSNRPYCQQTTDKWSIFNNEPLDFILLYLFTSNFIIWIVRSRSFDGGFFITVLNSNISVSYPQLITFYCLHLPIVQSYPILSQFLMMQKEHHHYQPEMPLLQHEWKTLVMLLQTQDILIIIINNVKILSL